MPDAHLRLYFLDWLRIIAFLALVLYHVGMYYVRWDFHVKSPFSGHGLEPWMKLTEPWRMSLLFMVSGAAAAHMLHARSALSIVRHRSRQLLLPLLLGVVLIVPPQAYFEVVQKHAYLGSYADFLGLYFSHDRRFCIDGKCLILPTWNHLWFLPYVWIYTVAFAALVALAPKVHGTVASAIEQATAKRGTGGLLLLLVPMLCLALARWALQQRYPSNHALWGDWFNHTMYASMFLAGAWMATQPKLWDRVAATRWPALLTAALAWSAMVDAPPTTAWTHTVTAVFQWSALMAAFGFAKQHLNVDGPWRQSLNEAVFPVYLLHQTVIVVASQWLLPLGWKPFVEGPLLVAITLVVSTAFYFAVRPINTLRPWVGLKPKASTT
jgi:glucans biosynthesis protein C